MRIDSGSRWFSSGWWCFAGLVGRLCENTPLPAIHLDSGGQRSEAHRFYGRKRMHVGAFHCAMALATEPDDTEGMEEE